jgi:hypothetical protein
VSGSTQCPHLEFEFCVAVARFEDTNIKYAEVTGLCKNCAGEVIFRGMPLGVSPVHPTMALGGDEARLPFLIGEEEYDGKALGFTGSLVKDPSQ